MENSRMNIASCFNKMITKKTQAVSSNLFVLAQEISDLFLRISNFLRSSQIFLSLDFPQLLDIQGKMLKFCNTKRFNKTPEWTVRFTILLGYHHIPFSSL